MSVFFRNYFSPRYSPEGDNKAFHSLYELVLKGGGDMYRIMFKVAIFAALMAVGFTLAAFVMSSHGRVMDENKAKLQRIAWICVGIGASAGMVGLIFNLFNWGF